MERRGNVLYFSDADDPQKVDAAVREMRVYPCTEPGTVTTVYEWTPKHLGAAIRKFQPGR